MLVFFADIVGLTPLPDQLRGNIQMRYYNAGHMMYLREADLEQLRRNIASFIDGASVRAN